jgi:hypothetical protein
LFEAGALSKIRSNSHVCTYLHDRLSPSDISGPLALFQSTKANKSETLALLRTINNRISEPIPQNHLEDIFETLWPRLEQELENVPKPTTESAPQRPDRELLEEILTTTRVVARDMGKQKSVTTKSNVLSASSAIRNVTKNATVAVQLLQDGMEVEGVTSVSPRLAVPAILAYVQHKSPRSSKALTTEVVVSIISRILGEADGDQEKTSATK